jgi:hypothetical protein
MGVKIRALWGYMRVAGPVARFLATVLVIVKIFILRTFTFPCN